MKRKIKLSFEALERELSQVKSNEMLNLLGGSIDPLPNGLCHFNMMSYLMHGNNSYGSSIRDDMYEYYGKGNFVDGVDELGRPVQEYDGNKLDGFMRLSGYNAYQIDNLSSSSLKSQLDSGARVGLMYDNHAWIVKDVLVNGDVWIEDNTNGGSTLIKSSDLVHAKGAYASNGCLTTDYLSDMFPNRYSTTVDDFSTTFYDDFSTTSY